MGNFTKKNKNTLYLDAVKKSEAERIRQKQLKKEKQLMEMYPDCDDDFVFITGYTSGGAPFGTQWWEIGIDPRLPFEEKIRLYHEGMYEEPDIEGDDEDFFDVF